jgi:pimeloyl-ACP methyl ester carboxylesterase
MSMPIGPEAQPTPHEVMFQHGDVRLAGLLLTPATAGPHPALVLIDGSGAGDRQSGCLPAVREHLVRQGLAVLVYDKPGCGGSSGDWRRQTFVRDRASEALAALRYLQGRPDIRPARVGLWGISQGGWVVLLAAARSPAVAFVVAVSAPGVSPAEQIVYELEHQLPLAGYPPAQVAQAAAFVGRLWGLLREDAPFARVEPLLAEARSAPWYAVLAQRGELDAEAWAWHRQDDFLYDPAPALAQVRCPVLAIFGEDDHLVPVRESAAVFRRALADAGNGDVTIRIFPQADHGIRPPSGAGFAPGYLDLMATWVRRRVGDTEPAS